MAKITLNSRTGEVSLNGEQMHGVKSIQIKMDLRKDDKGYVKEFAEVTLVVDVQECETELNIDGPVKWGEPEK